MRLSGRGEPGAQHCGGVPAESLRGPFGECGEFGDLAGWGVTRWQCRAAPCRVGRVAGQAGVIAGPALGGVIFAIEPVAVYATGAALLTASLCAVLAMRRNAHSST